MAQFDVYRPPASNRVAYLLFVVDVQSDLLANLETRQVMPLVDPKLVRRAEFGNLTPTVTVLDRPVLLYAHQMFSLPRAALGKPIASLGEKRDVITRAIDALLSGI
jgi:toxin CcdB